MQTEFAPTSIYASFARGGGGHAKKLQSTEGALGCGCHPSSRKGDKRQPWPLSVRTCGEGCRQGIEGSDRGVRRTVICAAGIEENAMLGSHHLPKRFLRRETRDHRQGNVSQSAFSPPGCKPWRGTGNATRCGFKHLRFGLAEIGRTRRDLCFSRVERPGRN